MVRENGKYALWQKRSPLSLIFLFFVTLILLTGCSGFIDRAQEQRAPDQMIILNAGHSVGQTFVSQHGGLNGVEFWLETTPATHGTLHFHLRDTPQASSNLATASLPLDTLTSPGFYRFSFLPDTNSHGVYRYAVLEIEGDGAIQVGAASADSYLNGVAYVDNTPRDAQLSFRLVHAPISIMRDIILALLGWAGVALVGGLLYLVPGYALLAWFLPKGRKIYWITRMGLAAGVSLALYPILLLWTNLFNLHLGDLYVWLTVGGGVISLLVRHRHLQLTTLKNAFRHWPHSEVIWPDVICLIALLLTFGVRFLVVRTLDAPMWGDSVQHTVIAQLLVDHGGLFNSWEPYAPYQSLTVHYGFHTAVALLSWATGLGATKATLIAGQVLNGLAALTLYPLMVRLTKGNRWAGSGAVIVAGLLSPMPGFYVNWGRYAQLTGQVILPVAIWLLWEAVEEHRHSLSVVFIAGLALAGMTLCYYRTPLFYAPFILAWLATWGTSHFGKNGRLWLMGLARLVFIAAIASLLLAPWGVRIMGGNLTTAIKSGVTSQSPLQQVLADYHIWSSVTDYLPLPLLLAALLGLAWAIIRRQWLVASVGLWVMLLALWVAGRLISFPAANMMQNFAIVISLYIPASLLIGGLIGAAMEWPAQQGKWFQKWVGSGLLLVLALIGSYHQAQIVQSQFELVTRPDMQAMTWIRENTSPDALFLVEGFRIYGGHSAVGSDAGWWIPLLAKRRNTMPPQYALFNESPIEAGYSQRVVKLIAKLETASPSSPEGLQTLCDWGISHIYIGQGQGKVGMGVSQLFSPQDFINSPSFDLLYHRDRVYIFALAHEACGEK